MSMNFPGGMGAMGGPLTSGFVDPYAMAEFRDATLYGTYSQDRFPGPKGVMNKPYHQQSTSNLSKTTSEATDYPSGQESDSLYSHPRRQNYYPSSSAASLSTISKQTAATDDGDTTDTETNNTYDVPSSAIEKAESEVNSIATGISLGAKSARSSISVPVSTLTDADHSELDVSLGTISYTTNGNETDATDHTI